MQILESRVERSICAYAATKNMMAHKLANGADRGWPDRLIATPQGAHFYVEFKGSGGRLSATQRYRIGQLICMKHEVYVVYSIGEGKEIVNYYANGRVGAAPLSRAVYKADASTSGGGVIARPWTREDECFSRGIQNS